MVKIEQHIHHVESQINDTESRVIEQIKAQEETRKMSQDMEMQGMKSKLEHQVAQLQFLHRNLLHQHEKLEITVRKRLHGELVPTTPTDEPEPQDQGTLVLDSMSQIQLQQQLIEQMQLQLQQQQVIIQQLTTQQHNMSLQMSMQHKDIKITEDSNPEHTFEHIEQRDLYVDTRIRELSTAVQELQRQLKTKTNSKEAERIAKRILLEEDVLQQEDAQNKPPLSARPTQSPRTPFHISVTLPHPSEHMPQQALKGGKIKQKRPQSAPSTKKVETSIIVKEVRKPPTIVHSHSALAPPSAHRAWNPAWKSLLMNKSNAFGLYTNNDSQTSS